MGDWVSKRTKELWRAVEKLRALLFAPERRQI
jgi:hypothetical protein